MWPLRRNPRRVETVAERPGEGLRAADAAVAHAADRLMAATALTPVVRALMAGIAELRAEDHFGERIKQAVRDDQGPADHAHGG